MIWKWETFSFLINLLSSSLILISRINGFPGVFLGRVLSSKSLEIRLTLEPAAMHVNEVTSF